ncbi:hypothetical protein ABGN05_07330 [Aquibium sp. LZ166]|uniref:DUF2569 family protein n=1 Tax=Aquibium pacificus TaxID=3153579 RepID=A0ABV3SFB8_9HYPH
MNETGAAGAEMPPAGGRGRSPGLMALPVAWIALIVLWSAYGIVASWPATYEYGLPDIVVYWVYFGMAVRAINILWGAWLLAHAYRRAAGFPRAFTLWQVFNIAVSLLSLAILFASDVFVVTGWSLAPPLAEIAAGSALILLVSRSKEAPLVFYDEGTTEPPGLVVAVNAILGAILGGIGGLVIGFAVGAMLVEILDVSCFEGGCGYFAAAIGLLGMLLGAVAGAVVAVWRTRRRGRTARAAT